MFSSGDVSFLIVLAGITGIAVGFLFGSIIHLKGMEKAAIDRGFAQYNNKTGKWEWKEPP